jgi:hypothetical protein
VTVWTSVMHGVDSKAVSTSLKSPMIQVTAVQQLRSSEHILSVYLDLLSALLPFLKRVITSQHDASSWVSPYATLIE